MRNNGRRNNICIFTSPLKSYKTRLLPFPRRDAGPIPLSTLFCKTNSCKFLSHSRVPCRAWNGRVNSWALYLPVLEKKKRVFNSAKYRQTDKRHQLVTLGFNLEPFVNQFSKNVQNVGDENKLARIKSHDRRIYQQLGTLKEIGISRFGWEADGRGRRMKTWMAILSALTLWSECQACTSWSFNCSTLAVYCCWDRSNICLTDPSSKSSNCSNLVRTLSTTPAPVGWSLTTTGKLVWVGCFRDYVVEKIPFSPPGKKLVTMDNFSDVVYLSSIVARLANQGSANRWAVSMESGAILDDRCLANCERGSEPSREQRLGFVANWKLNGQLSRRAGE